MELEMTYYKIKVTLVGTIPIVWRRLFVLHTMSLDTLHLIIQTAMGWKNEHPYIFKKGNLQYGKVSEEDSGTPDINDSSISLNMLLDTVGDTMNYVYDFGDNWEHVIVHEGIVVRGLIPCLSLCYKAKGTCPCEGSGGLSAYYEKLKNANDVNNPKREDLQDWLMEDIEDRKPCLGAINERLFDLQLQS
jgi:hypothetical protein